MVFRYLPEAEVDIVHPADPQSGIDDLDSYDAMLWTGSSLTIFHDDPAVTAQIELAREVFGVGFRLSGRAGHCSLPRSPQEAHVIKTRTGASSVWRARSPLMKWGARIRFTPSGLPPFSTGSPVILMPCRICPPAAQFWPPMP